jgi:hypothetical protein
MFLAKHGTRLKPASLEKVSYLLDAETFPQLGDRLVEVVARPDVLNLHAAMSDTEQ